MGGTADNGLGAELLYSGLHGQGYRDNNDNTDIDDFMLKTRYAFSDRDELLANFHYYDAKAGMPGGLSAAQYAQNPFQSTRPWDQFEGRRKDMSFKYKHQEDDKQFEVLTYFTDSYRGSNIESEGTGKNAGQRRMVSLSASLFNLGYRTKLFAGLPLLGYGARDHPRLPLPE